MICSRRHANSLLLLAIVSVVAQCYVTVAVSVDCREDSLEDTELISYAVVK